MTILSFIDPFRSKNMTSEPEKYVVVRQVARRPQIREQFVLLFFNHHDFHSFPTLEEAQAYAQQLFKKIRDRQQETIYIELHKDSTHFCTVDALYHRQ